MVMYRGTALPFEEGDSVLVALQRAGIHPTGGGTLCAAGDCPHCLCTVEGVPYTRACQTPARSGLVVDPHPADGDPPVPPERPNPDEPYRTLHADVVVVGRGESGTAAIAGAEAAGSQVVSFDAADGEEVVGIYAGPTVVATTPDGTVHVHCDEVVVATGAVEVQPACPGNDLDGLYTARAAEAMAAAGVDLGEIVAVGEPPDLECTVLDGELVRFEGDDRVEAVVIRTDGREVRHPCDTVALGLGHQPRDGLARQGAGLPVRAVGDAADPGTLPPTPESGVVCPCSDVDVDQLRSVWDRGFREVDLIKRATLACTGTCQGAVCLPHVRSFVAAHGGEVPAPFTARPVSRQLTMAEVAAGWHPTAWRRTGLHDVHVAAGGRLDRFGGWWRPWDYGDPVGEYRAVREGVGIMDVGTLGKMLVSGPDAVDFLERLFPCRVGDLQPGRSRYALLLDERGYVIDDGLVCRDDETRFTLTFTSGGASHAELWVRDWADTWGSDVRILDRTAALGAINVTGPRAGELMERVGLDEPLRFMRHTTATIAGVESRVFRLSFTGEVSYEVHHPAGSGPQLWAALLDAGADLGVRPHGLEALTTLRLEKGHVVVGQDTDFDSTPRRLGMEWAAKLDKSFVGRDALVRTNRLPLDKALVGLTCDAPAPDEGSVLWAGDRVVGQVTSSRFSPTLGHAVMLGWVDVVDGELPATVTTHGDRELVRTDLPFYDPDGGRARA